MNRSGAWPSGKATGFDPVIRRFESFRPRSILMESKDWVTLYRIAFHCIQHENQTKS